MDTSETYIKMCEKANEVQDAWKPEKGDFIYGNTLAYLDLEGDKLFVYGDWIELSDKYQTGWSAWDGPNNCKKCNEHGSDDDIDFIPGVWLPRQDQLQEMIGSTDPFDSTTLDCWNSFRDWVIRQCECRGIKTHEQYWLSFVMKEKYNKIWNGKDWVNETS